VLARGVEAGLRVDQFKGFTPTRQVPNERVAECRVRESRGLIFGLIRLRSPTFVSIRNQCGNAGRGR
jgi:hypothetical protein